MGFFLVDTTLFTVLQDHLWFLFIVRFCLPTFKSSFCDYSNLVSAYAVSYQTLAEEKI